MTRKLQEYYQFDLYIDGDQVQFRDTKGNELPEYRAKLTPGQWKLASKYLNRKLVPFVGYQYQPKIESKNGYINIIKIR